MLSSGIWLNRKKKSGILANPVKLFFLKLDKEIARRVNRERDEKGVKYMWKDMIRCGLALNLNRIWEYSQLFPHLQEIIKRYSL